MATTFLDSTTTLTHRPRYKSTGVLGGVLAVPGHNANATQYAQSSAGVPVHLLALADEGFVVHAMNPTVAASNTSSFASPAVTSAIGTAITTLKGLCGSPSTVALYGWSGGAADIIAAVIADSSIASQVSRIWMSNPSVDLDWAYALSGYTPAYSTGGVTPQAGWATELDTVWSGNYNSNVTAPYRLRNQATAYAALNIPTKVCQASDDATLPPAAAPWWVGQAAASHVTSCSPQPTGGHSLGVAPAADVVAFLRGWTS